MTGSFTCWLKKKILFLCIALTSCTISYADWDPAYCLSDDDDPNVLNDLAYQSFKDLKSNVLGYLSNSWCSAEKATLMMELVLITRPDFCVEIGAFTGSSVLPVAATLKHLGNGKIFAIDAWSNNIAIQNLDDDDPNRPWWSTTNMSEAYDSLQRMLTLWSLRAHCKVLRVSSSKAINYIKEEIDFLHLDGDYSEKGSLQDVELYLPKVKTGGYILLSNFFVRVKDKQPKLKAFDVLSDSCEIVAAVDNDNTVLFRKK